MKTENLKQVFDLFCIDEIYRPVYRAPFISTVHVCATDACSLIYADKDKFNSYIEAQAIEDTPNIESVIPTELHEPVYFSIAKLEQQLDEKCEKEDEYTTPEKVCTHCDGDGEVECNLGHDHECSHCDGSGYRDSPRKTGNQVINPETLVGMLGDTFRYEQIGRLIVACKLLGVDIICKVAGKPSKTHLFHVDEIKILVMPCLYNGEDVRVNVYPETINQEGQP